MYQIHQTPIHWLLLLDSGLQAWYFTEATEAVAPGLCLGALSKVPIEIYKFLIEVPFAKEKSPCPFKYEVSGLGLCILAKPWVHCICHCTMPFHPNPTTGWLFYSACQLILADPGLVSAFTTDILPMVCNYFKTLHSTDKSTINLKTETLSSLEPLKPPHNFSPKDVTYMDILYA